MQIDWLDFYGSGTGWGLFIFIGFLILLLAVPILFGMLKFEGHGVFRMTGTGSAVIKSVRSFTQHGMAGTILILMAMLAAFSLGIGSFLYYEWTMTNPPIMNDYALNSMTVAGVVTLIVCLLIFGTVMVSRLAKTAFEYIK